MHCHFINHQCLFNMVDDNRNLSNRIHSLSQLSDGGIGISNVLSQCCWQIGLHRILHAGPQNWKHQGCCKVAFQSQKVCSNVRHHVLIQPTVRNVRTITELVFDWTTNTKSSCNFGISVLQDHINVPVNSSLFILPASPAIDFIVSATIAVIKSLFSLLL